MVTIIQLQLFAVCLFLGALVVYLRITRKPKTKTAQPIAEITETRPEPDFRSHYPANFRADDGHMVRSKAELIIDNWLHHHRILHEYERQIKGELMTCDFYLPDADIYVEFWGGRGFEYETRKRQKLATYEKRRLRLVSLEDSDIEHLDINLTKKLRKHGLRM